MEVRDPIHGFIKYDPTEEHIIGTMIFQRLRNIKQLALASYVYPGAHHTRFEHCLGTMHLADRISTKLGISGNRLSVIRLSALLHDVGHGPFSHVSEQVLENHVSGELLKKYDAENAHELMSILIILKHPDLEFLGECRTSIANLLQIQSKNSIDKQIISGPIDVDKLDYLSRDSYFAGVRYGIFDIEKVINSVVLIKIGVHGETLGIKEEGLHAVEQLLLAKYHMNIQVYQHRVRRITDAMLIRGIEYALEEGLLKDLFFINDSIEYIKKYVMFNDDILLNEIINKGRGTALEYYRRIKERKLFKEVFEIKIDNINFPDGIILNNLKQISKEQMKDLEKATAEIFSENEHKIDKELVIADRQSVRNPTFKSPGIKINSNTIMVLQDSGTRLDFSSASPVFQNTSLDKTEAFHIYLPLDWFKEKEKRDEYIQKRKPLVKNALEEIVK